MCVYGYNVYMMPNVTTGNCNIANLFLFNILNEGC